MISVRAAFVVICTLAAGAAGCAAEPLDRPIKTSPVDTGPGTLTQARQYLTGKWTLVSMDLYPPNEPAIHAAATGTMTYDEYSNLNVEMRLKPETAVLAERIGIPVKDGIVATTGHAAIDIERHAISYVLDGQSPMRYATHPLDTNMPRFWEVNGNVLTLRTKDDKGTVLSVTVWRKQ